MKSRRVASVQAVTVCSIYCLAQEDFQLVLEEYPRMKSMMERVARERLAMIQRGDPPPTAPHSDPEAGPSSGVHDLSLLDPRLRTATEERDYNHPGAVV